MKLFETSGVYRQIGKIVSSTNFFLQIVLFYHTLSFTIGLVEALKMGGLEKGYAEQSLKLEVARVGLFTARKPAPHN